MSKHTKRPAPRSKNAERDRDMWAAYKAGATLEYLGNTYGLSREGVRAALRRMGKELRPNSWREPAFYLAKAERLREEADALEKVARELLAGRTPARSLLARTTGAR